MAFLFRLDAADVIFFVVATLVALVAVLLLKPVDVLGQPGNWER